MADNLDWDFDTSIDLDVDHNVGSKDSSFTLMENNSIGGKPDEFPAASSNIEPSERLTFKKRCKNELDDFFNKRYNVDSSEISTKQDTANISNVLLFTNEFANGAFNPRSSTNDQTKAFRIKKKK